MKKSNVLSVFLVANILLFGCTTNKMEVSSHTPKYIVDKNAKEGIPFAQEIIYNQFYANANSNSTWENLDVFYRKAIKTYENDKNLGFLKQDMLEILFLERRSQKGKFLFNYENTQKHNETIDFYAKELLSLNYRSATVALSIAKSLEKTWGNQKTENYLKNIAVMNREEYIKKKKSLESNNFETTKMPNTVRKSLSETIQEDLSALSTIQKYDIK